MQIYSIIGRGIWNSFLVFNNLFLRSVTRSRFIRLDDSFELIKLDEARGRNRRLELFVAFRTLFRNIVFLLEKGFLVEYNLRAKLECE